MVRHSYLAEHIFLSYPTDTDIEIGNTDQLYIKVIKCLFSFLVVLPEDKIKSYPARIGIRSCLTYCKKMHNQKNHEIVAFFPFHRW